MLGASNIAADVRLDAVPLLDGFAELASEGIESTLAPANRAAEAEIVAGPAQRATPRFAALFDPQTCGGLLMGVPAAHVAVVLDRLAENGVGPAAVIGDVVAARDRSRITLC
jgi:selenide,water dikinase